MPTPSDGHLLLELECRKLELEPEDAPRVLGDSLRRARRGRRSGCGVSRGGGHAPPVDDLREHDPRGERDADRRANGLSPPLPPSAARRASCGPDGATAPCAGLPVGRSLSLGARLDQARLQLAQELGIVGQRLRRAWPRSRRCRGSSVGDILVEPVRGRVDCWSAFVISSSPVALRRSRRARSSRRRRAAIVEAAPRPA